MLIYAHLKLRHRAWEINICAQILHRCIVSALLVCFPPCFIFISVPLGMHACMGVDAGTLSSLFALRIAAGFVQLFSCPFLLDCFPGSSLLPVHVLSFQRFQSLEGVNWICSSWTAYTGLVSLVPSVIQAFSLCCQFCISFGVHI